MTFYDMLAMSIGNLWRRKLRTFLTLLGVLIGTSSIVAMLSIALGMKEMVLAEYSQFGSATQITVSEGYSEDNSNKGNDALKLTESNIKSFEGLEHVVGMEPSINLDLTITQGHYTGWTRLCGVSKESLKKKEIGEGRLPDSNNPNKLEVLMGNTVLTNFYDDRDMENSGYYSTGELPDVDLMKKVFNATSYNENAVEPTLDTTSEEGKEEADDTVSETNSSADDVYTVRISMKVTGMLKGGPDDYSMDSEAMFVDIEQLKAYLTKNFKKGEIPGQPKDSRGRPFNEWVYNQVTVEVDDSENVDSVLQNIQDMGFQASSNKELIESAQQMIGIVELVLGAIGMIAFLVAAIGIANTMMMSTYERTREIGVMKVLGCDMKDIRMLFLSEAGFIGFIGGVAGLAFTMTLSAIANIFYAAYAASQPGMSGLDARISVIPWWLVLGAIAFATLMGMLAGYFPANRAMKLSPLAAIRNE